jgi:hypothetical protein
MQLLFGGAFRPAGGLLVGLTAGAVALAALTVTGLGLVAADRHLAASGGWVATLLATVLVLTAPLAIGARVELALVLGPLVGIVVHLAVLRAAPSGPAGSVEAEREGRLEVVL